MINQKVLKIRAASIIDVDALTELSHKTILIKYPDVIGQEMVEGYIKSGTVRRYYRDRYQYCQVVEVEGAPVGVCGLRDNSIDLMMVTVDRHREGIGSLLLKEAESILFQGHCHLFLNSFRDNHQAIDFYKKHAWTVDREFVDADYGIHMVEMIKNR